MMLRHVTVNEIVHAIDELMGDCQYDTTLSGKPQGDQPYNGGYYVTINNHPDCSPKWVDTLQLLLRTFSRITQTHTPQYFAAKWAGRVFRKVLCSNDLRILQSFKERK